MKLIKLTTLSDESICVNIKHLIAFWAQDDGKTRFMLTNEDNFGRVKETPEEIIELIKQAKEI